MPLRPAAVALGVLLASPCARGADPAPAPPVEAPAQAESPHLRFSLSPATGRYEILDKSTGVLWRSNPLQARFGEVSLAADGQEIRLPLDRCTVEVREASLTASFSPSERAPDALVKVTVALDPDTPALTIAWEADKALGVRSLRLLDNALWVSDADTGCALVPVRLGIRIPADSGVAFSRRFDTYAYEGCHMAMLGLVKAGTTALLTWDSPGVELHLESRTGNPFPETRQVLLPSLDLVRSAKGFRLLFCGRGDHVTIARAYREASKRKGWFLPWNEKLQDQADRAKLFGAVNVKLWSCLSRTMNRESTKEESVRVNWTFDEAAQVAEHLKNDLKLDRVLLTLGGWIHRGYDNQHPDILPAAEELGGDAALSACAKRTLGLGYLFCLHDNYQDMYRDAPSWDESFLQKRPDGKPAAGGQWAGGLAYLICSKRALDLAKRPANLPAVLKLTGAKAYFIDTTFAAGLQECHDTTHPLSRRDDLKWKQALSDYARGLFGVFGSECGREWAIPHADFFEGLTGVSGRPFHDAKMPAAVGGDVVPLFELVYRDTIALYGKYGYEPAQAAGYVLQHVLLGRTLNHHDVPPHLYWKEAARDAVDAMPAADIEPAGPRAFRVTYRWSVKKTPARDWRFFAHFCDADDAIRMQNDHAPDPPTTSWTPGEVRLGPFPLTLPDGVTGPLKLRIGLYDPDTHVRARFDALADPQSRVTLGTLAVTGDRVTFAPTTDRPGPDPAAAFIRADGGWADGLHPFDRFLKNTYEILSPLNELTARVPMTRHEFLSNDRAVQRTAFGEGDGAYTATVNLGPSPVPVTSPRGGALVLPPFGFVVEGPSFAAFHALGWNGLAYETPALFTMRSLDGRPLETSMRIRVYHGFGDDRIALCGNERRVAREEVVTVPE